MSGSGSKSKESGSSKRRVQIPDFLQPLLRGAAGTANTALGGLSNQLSGASGTDLVAGFNPAQQAAQGLGIQEALGGDFIGTAQDTFLDTARGTGLEQFLDPAALEALRGGASGSFGIPDSVRNTLSESQQLSQFVPGSAFSALEGAAGGSNILGQDTLEGLLGTSGIDPTAQQTLQDTASGDFLAGGQGFQEAIDAAVRAAQPGILSTFGGAGVGGANSGLAQAAIGQSATDAFARQFQQERQNQLGAAGELNQLSLADRGQQGGFANTLAQLGLTEGGQRLGAAGTLAGLGEGERARNVGAAGTLGQLGLAGGNQQLAAAGELGGFGGDERNRQLAAAGILPEIGSAGFNLLNSIGGEQQGQAQRQLDAPIQAQLQLLSAALGGLPIAQLLGANASGESTSTKLGFEGFKGFG